MTLRPEYSLGHSACNGFLFASVGADAAGTDLTVLSALTRLGLDPWQEAAWLADMPREMAATVLAATIARLPPGTWAAAHEESEAARIAERLVAALPSHSAPAIPEVDLHADPHTDPQANSQAIPPINASRAAAAERKRKSMKAKYPVWLMWGALAVTCYLLIVQMTSDRNLEPAPRPATMQR